MLEGNKAWDRYKAQSLTFSNICSHHFPQNQSLMMLPCEVQFWLTSLITGNTVPPLAFSRWSCGVYPLQADGEPPTHTTAQPVRFNVS